jgi:hypothetical protein
MRSIPTERRSDIVWEDQTERAQGTTLCGIGELGILQMRDFRGMNLVNT